MARPTAQNSSASSPALTLGALAFVVAILYFAREVLLPLALAILLSFLLTPLTKRLERWRLGRVPSVVLVVSLAFALIGGIGWVVTQQMVDLVGQIPKYQENLTEKIRSVRGSFGGSPAVTKAVKEIGEELSQDTKGDAAQAIEETRAELTGDPDTGPVAAPHPERSPDDDPSSEDAEVPLPVRIVENRPMAVTLLTDWLGPILAPLGTAAIVVVFVIFLMIQREDLRNRLIRLVGTGRVYVTTHAFDEAAERVSRYLLMQLIINATYGVAVAVGLWWIGSGHPDGFPSPLLWGLLATVMRFVPYVGPWVAAAMPIALSLAVFPGWTLPLMTVGLFVLLELVSNNIMEPWLYGSSTGLSAVGIIVAAVFWTWLWGPIGLVLSTPLTVCMVVLGRHVPRLNFLNVLLSDEPALELNVRFYQRLLAFDDHEADDIVEHFLKTGSLDELYEGMLIPALSLSERDRHAGHLSEGQQKFIHKTVRAIIDELGEEFDMTAAAGETVPAGAAEQETLAGPQSEARRGLRILCVPAEDRADRLAGRMLVQLLTARGHMAETATVNVCSGMLPGILTEKDPDVIIISALAPGGAMQAASGCKKLRPRFPEVKIAVGLWNARGTLTKSRQRLKTVGADLVITSISDGLQQVQEFAETVPVAR